jgi:hypothetical protein
MGSIFQLACSDTLRPILRFSGRIAKQNVMSQLIRFEYRGARRPLIAIIIE